MKPTLKVVVFISLIAVLSSFAGTIVPGEKSDLPAPYSIQVFTKPDCYTGTCRIQDQSNLNVYNASSTGSSYYYAPNGLGPGTYTVVVCCDGMVGYGTVTLTAPSTNAVITVELQPGTCPDLGN
ncbi:MAG: hypothetical protein JSS63_06435 [Bacteroidetes bacterium]|nr:hypothetical protein [Bacteroidota bacterium]